MIRTIIESYFYVNYWIVCKYSFFHRLNYAFLNSRAILLRNNTSYDFINKLIAASSWKRFYLNPAVSILASSTRLLFIFAWAEAEALIVSLYGTFGAIRLTSTPNFLLSFSRATSI